MLNNNYLIKTFCTLKDFFYKEITFNFILILKYHLKYYEEFYIKYLSNFKFNLQNLYCFDLFFDYHFDSINQKKNFEINNINNFEYIDKNFNNFFFNSNFNIKELKTLNINQKKIPLKEKKIFIEDYFQKLIQNQNIFLKKKIKEKNFLILKKKFIENYFQKLKKKKNILILKINKKLVNNNYYIFNFIFKSYLFFLYKNNYINFCNIKIYKNNLILLYIFIFYFFFKELFLFISILFFFFFNFEYLKDNEELINLTKINIKIFKNQYLILLNNNILFFLNIIKEISIEIFQISNLNLFIEYFLIFYKKDIKNFINISFYFFFFDVSNFLRFLNLEDIILFFKNLYFNNYNYKINSLISLNIPIKNIHIIFCYILFEYNCKKNLKLFKDIELIDNISVDSLIKTNYLHNYNIIEKNSIEVENSFDLNFNNNNIKENYFLYLEFKRLLIHIKKYKEFIKILINNSELQDWEIKNKMKFNDILLNSEIVLKLITKENMYKKNPLYNLISIINKLRKTSSIIW